MDHHSEHETILDPDRTTHLGIERDELDDISGEFFDRNVSRLRIAEFIGPALADHCYTEMTHLAQFLPRLYERVTSVGPPGH